MATNVNVFYSNFRLGTNITIQRRLVDVIINWIDDTGLLQTRTRTITFPDDLVLIPTEILKEELIELMIQITRRVEGIDP